MEVGDEGRDPGIKVGQGIDGRLEALRVGEPCELVHCSCINV